MNGAVTWARLSFRQQRLEILFLGAAVLLASGLMLWWAFELDGIGKAYPDCEYFDPALACQAAGQRFSETFSTAEIIIRNTWLAGFAIGLVLGVPLVAREIEHGTAQLSWTIGRSRTRWLIGRVAFGALVTVLLTGALAITTEVLASAMLPKLNMSQDFHFYGGRGPLIVGRAMLGLGAGVLVGALLGRQLPALLLGIIVIGGLYAASHVAFQHWYETEAVIASPYREFLGGPLWIDNGIELTSGELVSMMEEVQPGLMAHEAWIDEEGTAYANEADFEARRNPIGRDAVLIIPGERQVEIVVRESIVLAGAGAILVVAAAVVTGRRRPA
jgi:hypothetical protein